MEWLTDPTLVREVQRVGHQILRQQILLAAAVHHYCILVTTQCAVTFDGVLWPEDEHSPRPVHHGSYAQVIVPPPPPHALPTQKAVEVVHQTVEHEDTQTALFDPANADDDTENAIDTDDADSDDIQLTQVAAKYRNVATFQTRLPADADHLPQRKLKWKHDPLAQIVDDPPPQTGPRPDESSEPCTSTTSKPSLPTPPQRRKGHCQPKQNTHLQVNESRWGNWCNAHGWWQTHSCSTTYRWPSCRAAHCTVPEAAHHHKLSSERHRVRRFNLKPRSRQPLVSSSRSSPTEKNRSTEDALMCCLLIPTYPSWTQWWFQCTVQSHTLRQCKHAQAITMKLNPPLLKRGSQLNLLTLQCHHQDPFGIWSWTSSSSRKPSHTDVKSDLNCPWKYGTCIMPTCPYADTPASLDWTTYVICGTQTYAMLGLTNSADTSRSESI